MHPALLRRPTPVAPPFHNSCPAGPITSEVRSLSPTEAFVLSRVDGRRSIEDIAVLTGLSAQETQQILRSLLVEGRLKTLGPSVMELAATRTVEHTPDEELTWELEEPESEHDRPTVTQLDDPFARPTRPVLWVGAADEEIAR